MPWVSFGNGGSNWRRGNVRFSQYLKFPGTPSQPHNGQRSSCQDEEVYPNWVIVT
jgi:hypothetical protein